MAEITAAMVKQLRDKTGAGMMECKAALTEANGNMEEAITLLRKRGLAQAAKRAGRDHRAGHDRQLHPHGRQDRRARRGELRVGLRGAHGRLQQPRQGSRRCTSPPPSRAGSAARTCPAEAVEKEKAIYRAQMEKERQARPRARQDHRGQARQLLLAVRAARPAVRPRRQGDRQPARGPGQRQDRREHPGQPVRSLPGRRSGE